MKECEKNKKNKSEDNKSSNIVYHKRYSENEDVIKKTANHIRKIKSNG